MNYNLQKEGNNMSYQDHIIIKGLKQNNLKNVSLEIPKGKIIVFTGVSGSGKSSIVFDTIAAESQRQMNETYSAFIRGRLPKYKKPRVDFIDNLSASVIIDQSRLGGNARSTVGTISDMYSAMRLLYSRIGKPYVGTASYFSFNDPNGMCPECSGIGKILDLDMDQVLAQDKSWNEGMVQLPAFSVNNWYWKQYTQTGLFDLDKKWADYSEREKNLLLYGAYERGGKQVNKKIEGIYNHLNRLLIKRDLSSSSDRSLMRLNKLVKERECPVCRGKRLNEAALSCRVNGYSIDEMCEMEFTRLYSVLSEVRDPRGEAITGSLTASLKRMIEIGLPYLSMNRESTTLSGGEAQRLKLVRYMGSSLTNMIYIFDEPSTGMHPRDVHRMTGLLKSLRSKGNTVLVVEHDKDVISIADEVIDVGPMAGRNGGRILYQGSYEGLLDSGTLTGNAMKEYIPVKEYPRKAEHFLPVRGAALHNLKNVSVDIPTNVLTVVTGVAGSGKSSLIRDVFAREYEDRVVLVDQSPITATGRSTPATFLGFFDHIRKLLADENGVEASLFSFNSRGACPACKGRGVVITELVFMDPVTTVCEACDGSRYSDEALSYRYKGKNMIDILNMTAEEAAEFFSDSKKIHKQLQAMIDAGLSYLTLGQPLSTLSGGERQRVKLAKYLDKKGNIYLLDEPTTGLHASDVKNIMKLLDGFVRRGNTVIVIEHNLDVMKQADYIIDIGPDGGTNGGEVVFTGTPQEMADNADTITARYLRKSLE
ncbi:ATP-binding cassette domain-containing protein [Faecalicatena orotica]|uniref:ATP-binding cassette domain-containing protein n=1 Tax=Faecalicatena orotica TaxID=1544 RepID=UPI003D2EC4BD